ncbi:hypothetical protein [Acidiphilium sp.]|uniref:hypothetical protein n=1 Tax=Acidiphilium sp. TaxID=527 RepID=UPI00258798E7|nr:hypothetical protein [Acidiphilium sp.]
MIGTQKQQRPADFSTGARKANQIRRHPIYKPFARSVQEKSPVTIESDHDVRIKD